MSRKLIRLLIAEDEKMFADMLQMILKQNGYSPDVVYRGDDAIQKIESKNYDIVLTDIRMPGATGLDVLKAVKECDIDTQVVVISAYGDAGNILEALRLGASDFIQKPIEMPELIPNVIEKIYERRKLRVENRELLNHLSRRTRELEEALQTIKLQQEKIVQSEKFKVIGSMAAGLAIEINNPLAAVAEAVDQVDNVAQTMKGKLESEGGAFAGSLRQVLDNASATMKDGITRVSQITMALRTFSKMERTTDDRVLLKDCVHDALNILAPMLKEIELEVTLHSENLPVTANKQNLTHAIMNFVRNSCDALEGSKERKIRIVSSVESGRQGLIISDSGPGIEQGIRNKISEPFFTTRPLGKGSGMGLPIAVGIIQGSGGEIEIDSERGRGTTIKVYWKVA